MKLFDKILWRINGILILSVSLVVGIIALYAVWEIFKDKTRERNVQNIVKVNEQTKNKESLRLGSFNRVRGTSFFSSPLYSNESIERRAYSKSSSSVRNYFYYDSNTFEGHWLFDSNNFLLVRRNELVKNVPRKRESQVIGFVFSVVESDTSGDNLLTSKDLTSIYLSSASGRNVKKIIEEVISVLGFEQDTSEELILFIRKKSGDYVYYIDITQQKTTKKVKINIK